MSALVLGQAEHISGRCLTGIGCIVVGCFLLPMRRFREFRVSNYLNACCALALLAAFGTAGYSMLDDHGLRVLRDSAATRFGVVDSTLVYAPLEMVSSALWLSGLVLLLPGERQRLPDVIRRSWKPAALLGVGICAAYLLVLAAMAFVTNVSYVVAFRQLSVPVGALLGIVVLREPNTKPKLVGLAVVSVGLWLVGLG